MNSKQQEITIKVRETVTECGERQIDLDAWPVNIGTDQPDVIIRATAQQFFQAIPPVWIVGLTYEKSVLKDANGQDVVFTNLSGVEAMQTVERLSKEIKDGAFADQIKQLESQAT